MRPWLVSVLVVGGIVAAVLAFRDADGAAPDPGTHPNLPPPLKAKEVRDYMEIWPKVKPIYPQAAEVFQEEWTKTGKMPDGAEMQARVKATMATILQPHRYTLETWRDLQVRVEAVVDAIRREKAGASRLAEVEDQIERKKTFIAMHTDDEGFRETLEADLKALEEEKAAIEAGERIHESDRELVTPHWKKLDEIAPKPRSGAPRPPG